MSKDANYQMFRYPRFLHPTTGVRMPNDTGWQDRHMEALDRPTGHERAIVSMIGGWAQYADATRTAYGAEVTDDGVLGEAWKEIGHELIALLNGETGRLDCGTLDAFIRDAAGIK